MNKQIVVAIAADHRGYALKEHIIKHVTGCAWIDLGAYSDERSDYPLYARAAITALQEARAERAVLLCGTGIGMSIVANRFQGIYAGLAWNVDVARRAREDDHCNVLVLPADYIDAQQTLAMVHAWLTAEPRGGRYEQRLAMIDQR